MRRRLALTKLAVVAALCVVLSAIPVPGASAGPPARIDCATPDVNFFDDPERAHRPSQFGSESNAPFTCIVTDSANQLVGAGATVRGEATSETGSVNDPDDGSSFSTPDYSCTTGGDGSCTVTVTQSDGQTGTSTICFFLNPSTAAAHCANEEYLHDDVDGADEVRVVWETRSASKGGVDVEPETAILPRGGKHVVGAAVYDQFGYEFAGNTTVRFEVYAGSPSDVDESTSPASPDRTCITTTTSNMCSVTFSSNTLGRELLCVWINNRPPTMTGSNTRGVCGTFEGDEPGVFDPASTPNHYFDEVDFWWQEPALIGGGLDAEPEFAIVSPRSKHVVSVKVHDDQGVPYAGAIVKYEFAPGSISRDQSTENAVAHEPDGTCITSAAGICSFAYKQTKGIGGDWICIWLNGFHRPALVTGQHPDQGTCGGEGLTDADDQPGAFDDPAPLDDDVDMIKIKWAKPKGA